MKAHLLDSDVPILEGSTVTANCGKEVPNMKAVFWMEGSVELASFSALLFCQGCLKNMGASKKYLYALVNGQELTHGEG